MLKNKITFCLIILIILLSSTLKSKDKDLLDKLKDLGDSSFDTAGKTEYLNYVQQNETETNKAISFNSTNLEYIDNAHPQGNYSNLQALNQPFSHKIIRCFRIFFLKQTN